MYECILVTNFLCLDIFCSCVLYFLNDVMVMIFR